MADSPSAACCGGGEAGMECGRPVAVVLMESQGSRTKHSTYLQDYRKAGTRVMLEKCLGCRTEEGAHSQGCAGASVRARQAGQQGWEAAMGKDVLTCRTR